MSAIVCVKFITRILLDVRINCKTTQWQSGLFGEVNAENNTLLNNPNLEETQHFYPDTMWKKGCKKNIYILRSLILNFLSLLHWFFSTLLARLLSSHCFSCRHSSLYLIWLRGKMCLEVVETKQNRLVASHFLNFPLNLKEKAAFKYQTNIYS